MKHGRIAAILPIGKLFDQIFARAIAPAAKEAGSKISRIGAEFSSPGALGQICQSLEAADLVLADITARNPHVMFLAGYALGIGRDVRYLVQHGEDFPFHKASPIVYASNLDFLKSELQKLLAGGESSAAEGHGGDAREQFLATFGDLLKKHQHEHRGEIYLENPTTFVLVGQDMDLALVQDLARRGREIGIRLKLM